MAVIKKIICYFTHKKYRKLTALTWAGHDHTCTKCNITFYD